MDIRVSMIHNDSKLARAGFGRRTIRLLLIVYLSLIPTRDLILIVNTLMTDKISIALGLALFLPTCILTIEWAFVIDFAFSVFSLRRVSVEAVVKKKPMGICGRLFGVTTVFYLVHGEAGDRIKRSQHFAWLYNQPKQLLVYTSFLWYGIKRRLAISIPALLLRFLRIAFYNLLVISVLELTGCHRFAFLNPYRIW